MNITTLIRTVVAFLIAAIIAGPAAAQNAPQPPSPSTLTFAAALQRTLEANRATGRARAESEISKQQSRFLYANLFPYISVNGHYTRNAEEVSLDFDGMKINMLPLNDWSFRLLLEQPLYAGGREIRAYRQSQLFSANADQAIRSAEDLALLRTSTAYLGVVQGNALVDTERSNIVLSERRRTQAQNFFQAGEVTRVDILRAETAVKASQRHLAAAEQARESALSSLRLQLALETTTGVEESAIVLPQIPDETELLAQAERNRPELRQAENLLRAAQLQVRNERAARLPVVTANLAYTQQKANFPTDTFTAATVNFSMPVWDNGQISSRVAQARQQEQQAELMLEEARQGVREQIHLATIDLQTARTNVALAKDQLEAAQAEYDQMFDLYRAQEATSLDLEASESALAEARRAVVIGTNDLTLAELRVWSAAGSLKTVLVSEETR